MIYWIVEFLAAMVVLALVGPFILQWFRRRRMIAARDRRERADKHIETRWHQAVAKRREAMGSDGGLSNGLEKKVRTPVP